MSTPPSVRSHGAAPALTEAASAEAWDAWFRWREGRVPLDEDIEDTWRRVAATLAAADPDGGAIERDMLDALGCLQALPEPRILATAGCGAHGWPGSDLGGVVNLAALVRDPFTAQARFDHGRLAALAGIAVRMLDDAALLASTRMIAAPTLRIGVIGCADALLMLRLRYGGGEACAFVRGVAATLAAGCYEQSVRLAVDRGACGAMPAAECLQALPAALAHDIARHGLRHAALIAVDPQPRLALLANNVADALDPLRGERQWYAIDAAEGTRMVRSSGSTLTAYRLRRTAGAIAEFPLDTAATVDAAARAAMRAAMQPWIGAASELPA